MVRANDKHTESAEHSRPPLLPEVRERPRRVEDHTDVRGTELLREEVRLRPTDDREFERGVELGLDVSLERDYRRNDVCAARPDDQRDFSLCTPCQLQRPITQLHGR